jgi:6-phosphogluconolactonase
MLGRTTLSAIALLFSSMIAMNSLSILAAQEVDVWLGTGGKPSQGIYHCRLNLATGKLSDSKLVAEISGPGFLAMHPNLSHLYAVGSLDGKPSVVAYSITGRLADAGLDLVNAIEIGDGGAAHVSIDRSGKMLLTAQYGGGSIAAFQVNDDGSIRQRTELIKHHGGSRVVAGRQDGSHAHWGGFSPDQQFVFVPDLGLDQVVIYRANIATAKLEPHGFGAVPPGGGPRHMKFHPYGKWIYVLNELDLSVSVFDYDAAAGSMTIKQTIPTVSKAELAKEQFSSCSEIRVHPNGKFVYAANRGHDSITVFSVAEDGQLMVVQNEHVRGATPRNFNLAPGAKWLLAAGQDSHTLASFALNSDTGEMTYNRSIIQTPTPICVLIGPE